MKRSKLAALLLISVLIACFFRVSMNIRTPSGSNGAGPVKITRVDESDSERIPRLRRTKQFDFFLLKARGLPRGKRANIRCLFSTDRRFPAACGGELQLSEVPETGKNRSENQAIAGTGSPVSSEQPEGTVENRELEDNRSRPQSLTGADPSESDRKTDGEPVSRCVSRSVSGDSIGSGRKIQEDGTEQEPWICIVRISVPEEYAEDMEIVIPKDFPSAPMAFSGGFFLEGNDVQIPCCLMIRSRDAAGMEFIQYLPWNPNHPNEFQPLSPMREYASIAAYEGPRLMGRFYINEWAGGEMISLDLNAGQDRMLASL
jgi:hypothetical protein